MQDSSRYNLVTNFNCAQCGDKLRLTYDRPMPKGEYDPEKEDGITGADKVEASIYIHPCNRCFSELKEPLDTLRKILKDK